MVRMIMPRYFCILFVLLIIITPDAAVSTTKSTLHRLRRPHSCALLGTLSAGTAFVRTSCSHPNWNSTTGGNCFTTRHSFPAAAKTTSILPRDLKTTPLACHESTTLASMTEKAGADAVQFNDTHWWLKPQTSLDDFDDEDDDDEKELVIKQQVIPKGSIVFHATFKDVDTPEQIQEVFSGHPVWTSSNIFLCLYAAARHSVEMYNGILATNKLTNTHMSIVMFESKADIVVSQAETSPALSLAMKMKNGDGWWSSTSDEELEKTWRDYYRDKVKPSSRMELMLDMEEVYSRDAAVASRYFDAKQLPDTYVIKKDRVCGMPEMVSQNMLDHFKVADVLKIPLTEEENIENYFGGSYGVTIPVGDEVFRYKAPQCNLMGGNHSMARRQKSFVDKFNRYLKFLPINAFGDAINFFAK